MATSSHPRTIDLNEHDLGAHCSLRFTLFGNESLRVQDLRGEPGDPSAWMVVEVKNLTLTGRMSTLRALGEALVTLCDEAKARPDDWADVPAWRARTGDAAEPLRSAFVARLDALPPTT